MRALFAVKSFIARYWSTLLVSAVSIVGAIVVVIGENDRATLPFVFSVFAALLCIFLALSGRLAFSMLATWSILAVATALSAMKMKFMGV